MRFKIILLSILSILMISCSTKVTPIVGIPDAPVATKSVKPSLEKTQRGIENAYVANVQLQEKIKEQKQNVIDQKIDIVDALAQAEKIKEKAEAKIAITEIEATNLLNSLNKVSARNLFLEKKVKEFEDWNYKQLEILEATRQDARKTLAQLSDKENENSQLIAQNKFLTDSLNTRNKEFTQVQKDNLKLTKTSASAQVYKRWIIGSVGIVLLLGIGYVVMRTYVPTFKVK